MSSFSLKSLFIHEDHQSFFKKIIFISECLSKKSYFSLPPTEYPIETFVRLYGCNSDMFSVKFYILIYALIYIKNYFAYIESLQTTWYCSLLLQLLRIINKWVWSTFEPSSMFLLQRAFIDVPGDLSSHDACWILTISFRLTRQDFAVKLEHSSLGFSFGTNHFLEEKLNVLCWVFWQICSESDLFFLDFLTYFSNHLYWQNVTWWYLSYSLLHCWFYQWNLAAFGWSYDYSRA